MGDIWNGVEALNHATCEEIGGVQEHRVDQRLARQRIFIVAAHPLLRLGVQKLLESDENLEFSGAVGSAEEALSYLATVPVDLVMIDLDLPDRSGLALLAKLHGLDPTRHIIAMAGSRISTYAERSLSLGATGFIAKATSTEHLLKTIHQALKGEIVVGEEAAAALVRRALGKRAHAETDIVSTLTRREFQVFELIGRGLDTSEIAAQLEISRKTVETHQSNVKAKLGTSSSRALVRLATEWLVVREH